MKKTTPENVEDANKGLFHATMNLPSAAAHCGMTQKEMKMTFREYLKYHAPDYKITENPATLPRWQESSCGKTVPIPPRPYPGKRV